MKASLKKPILIGIASTAGVLLLAALGWFIYFNAQFNTYQDPDHRFSIKYPKTWRILPYPMKDVAVLFLRPKDTALDLMEENFSVTIQVAPVMDRTVAAFSATVKRQMTAVFKKNINIVEDRPIKWGWREGHLMAFEAPHPQHLKMVTAWLLRGDKAYLLNFLGDMNKYAHDSVFVNEMIRSFQLQQ